MNSQLVAMIIYNELKKRGLSAEELENLSKDKEALSGIVDYVRSLGKKGLAGKKIPVDPDKLARRPGD